ncbi:MAG TPA: YhbY family RNA-binding protein [Polyangiaceae bacterium]
MTPPASKQATESASAKQPKTKKRARQAVVLDSKQRSYLRGLGHSLASILQIGKAGPTEALLSELERALEFHELVKVRLLRECPTEPAEVQALLEKSLGVSVVGSVGRVVLLYRERTQDPVITLPGNPKPVKKPNAAKPVARRKQPPIKAARTRPWHQSNASKAVARREAAKKR